MVIRIKNAKALGPLAVLAGVRPPPPPPRKRETRRRLAADLATPGDVIACFEVSGQAVPWRAPLTGAGGLHYTPEHVVAWKETVARAAEAAGFGESTGQAPYRGPVHLIVYVCRKAPRGRRPGDRWDARPDADNLFKGLGDAVSGNVFKAAGVDPETGNPIPARLMPPSSVGRILADDNLVTDVVILKRYWTRPLCYLEVVAVDRHDPGPYPFSE